MRPSRSICGEVGGADALRVLSVSKMCVQFGPHRAIVEHLFVMGGTDAQYSFGGQESAPLICGHNWAEEPKP
jgi:hypothetical protein